MSTRTIVTVCLVAFAILMMLVGGGTQENIGATIFVWILAVLAVFLLPKSNNDTEKDKR